MKASHIYLIASLLSLTVLTSGSCVAIGKGITPSKNYITRNYKVTEFSAIDISTVGDVYYTQSTDGKTSVEVYGPDNIVDLVQASIADNTLSLTMEKKNRIRNVKKMKITISTPHLNKITFNGVGDVFIQDGLVAGQLSINHHGVGDLDIRSLTCEELLVSSTGVGDTQLSGKAKVATLSARGVGNIEAFNLVTVNLTASSGGVGNITCHATESISASVNGVGNIEYKGNPQEKRINKSGVGSIKQL